MKKNTSLKKPVEALNVTQKSVSKLLEAMAETGFQGKKLGQATSLIEKMVKNQNMTIFLGYAGSLSTTGQWKLITWLIEHHYIDVLVSTGANISEDIVEAMGFNYWQGTHLANDNLLFKQGLNRYYDLYGKEDDYLKMTELIAEFIQTLKQGYLYSSREFLQLFGRWLWKKNIRSIVAYAAKYGVPVFCPAIADSPYGDASLIAKSNGFSLTIDGMKDYLEFMKLAEHVKETSVIYIGGGVPKDFIQLFAVTSDLLYHERKVPKRTNYLTRKGTNETYYPHKYSVQITTDSPQWGGLSGCTLDEAISWGKIANSDDHITCYCEATIALPLITHALNERMNGKKRAGTNFAKAFSLS